MTDLLRRFAAYCRPHRGLFALDFSSFVSIIETYPKGIVDFQRYTTFVDTRPVIADLTLTATWADNLVVLDRGTVVAEGPPLRRLSVRPSVTPASSAAHAAACTSWSTAPQYLRRFAMQAGFPRIAQPPKSHPNPRTFS